MPPKLKKKPSPGQSSKDLANNKLTKDGVKPREQKKKEAPTANIENMTNHAITFAKNKAKLAKKKARNEAKNAEGDENKSDETSSEDSEDATVARETENAPLDVNKEVENKYMATIIEMEFDLTNKELQGSHNVALRTINLIKRIVKNSPKYKVSELCDVLREVGARFSRVMPQEFVAPNLIRRVLKAIRDEFRPRIEESYGDSDSSSDEEEEEEAGRKPSAAAQRLRTLGFVERRLRNTLRNFIAELMQELVEASHVIYLQAVDHIHTHETLMIFGASRITEEFLVSAAEEKEFNVIHIEDTFRKKESREMCKRLKEAGVKTTLLPDTSIFTFMARVNKVVLGVRAVLASGEVVGNIGIQNVAMSADYYKVPVYYLVPTHKITPLYKYDEMQVTTYGCPDLVLPNDIPESAIAQVKVPLYEVVPAEYGTMILSNLGLICPPFMYQALLELYDREDYDLDG